MQIRLIAIQIIILFILVLDSLSSQVSMAEVLDTLEHTYQISFAYNSDIINNLTSDFPPKELQINDALRFVVGNHPIDFKIINNQKVLLRDENIPTTANQESEMRIKGKIFDFSTNTPLPYAAIFTDDLSFGTTSDDLGSFELEIDTSSVKHINIQYLGFESQRISTTGIKENLDIYLMTSLQEIGPIDVVEKEPIISYFRNISNVIHVEHLSSGIGLGINDPIGKLKLMSGFAAYEDLSANASFRGSGSDANMYLLDGLPIIDINHFFGIFSSIQESIVDEIQLYKNNWPIEIGGKTSALVNMKSVESDSLSGSLSINNMTAQGHLNIPINSFGEILISGRTTITDISNSGLFGFLYDDPINTDENQSRSRLISIEPFFKFNDFYLKGAFEVTPQTTLNLSYFASHDRFEYLHDRNVAVIQNRRLIPIKESFQEKSDWSNSVFGISLNQKWNNRLQSSIKFNHSNYTLNEEIDISVGRFPLVNLRKIAENDFYNQADISQFQWNNNYSGFNDLRLKFGYQLEQIKTESDIRIDEANIPDFGRATNQHTGFLFFEKSTVDDFYWSFGTRSTWDTFNEELIWSPQLNLKYYFPDGLQLKTSIGYSQQVLRQSDYEDRFGRKRSFWMIADQRIPKLSSLNTMIGMTKVWSDFALDIEVYNKQLDGVIEYVLLVPNIPRGSDGNMPMTSPAVLRIFDGKGHIYGMDVEINYSSKYFSSLLSYSLSKATQSINELNNGKAYASQNDRRHQLKTSNTFKWQNWNLYLDYIYTSGRPYLDLSLGDFITSERQQISYDQSLTRLKPYSRVDIGVEYSKPFAGNKSVNIGASIFNLLNTQNEAYRQNVYSIEQLDSDVIYGNSIQMLDITPSIYLKFVF